MRDTKYFYEYLNNENPFAFLNSYDKNKFIEEKTKKRLESLQKIQPKFIPCAMDHNVLSSEHNSTMNLVITNGINRDISRGLELLKAHGINVINNPLETFKKHLDLGDMEDIVLNIYRLKLLSKQNILRNKVHEALKERVDEETIAGIDFEKCKGENSLEDARRLIELEEKKSEIK